MHLTIGAKTSDKEGDQGRLSMTDFFEKKTLRRKPLKSVVSEIMVEVIARIIST